MWILQGSVWDLEERARAKEREGRGNSTSERRRYGRAGGRHRWLCAVGAGDQRALQVVEIEAARWLVSAERAVMLGRVSTSMRAAMEVIQPAGVIQAQEGAGRVRFAWSWV